MWNDLLTLDLKVYMCQLKDEEGNTLEDEAHVNMFFMRLRKFTNVHSIVYAIKNWDKYDDMEKMRKSLQIVPESDASRYMIMVDYLHTKYKMGRLKL